MQGLQLKDFGRFVYGSDEFKKDIEGVYIYRIGKSYVRIRDKDGFNARVLKKDISLFEPQEKR